MKTSALPQYNHHGTPRRRRLSLPVTQSPIGPARMTLRGLVSIGIGMGL
jgi:hypothetical protein